jgi:cysteine desulfurase
MATALRITAERRQQDCNRMELQRDRLIEAVLLSVPDTRVTGHRTQRLPNNASFAFADIDGNELLIHLDMAGVAASSGSACKTGSPEPSTVMGALGLSQRWVKGSLRLSMGRQTENEDIEHAISVLPDIIQRMRSQHD